MDLYLRRRISNGIVLTLSLIATGIGLMWLALILGTLLSKGFSALSPVIFTQTTPPPGSAGGLINAIYGSVVMTLCGALFGAPVGLLAGTYLAEYSQGNRVADVIRFVNDILDRKSTRLNSSHVSESRMPSSA